MKQFSRLIHLVKYFSTLRHQVKYFSTLRHLVKYFSTLRHLVKYISTFYATRWFTIMLTAPSHRSDLSLMNPVHILQLYFFKFSINVILQPMLQFSSGLPPAGISPKSLHLFSVPFVPHSQSILYHTNNPSRGLKPKRRKLGPSPHYEGV